MPTFKHDGIQFHYEGRGSGLPFFFQHGLGADVKQPFELFKPPEGIRMIAFDVRAHGQTTPIGDAAKLRFETFGEDLLALMKHLAIERAIVGGISMGAALALHFALRWPERVVGLVLSRPAWLEAPSPWNVKMFTLIADLIRRYGAERGLAEFKQTAQYREAIEKWPDVANSLCLQFQNPRVEETVSKFERIIRDTPHPERRAWYSLKLPTLVLGNRQDPVHPFAYAEELARSIPNAEFTEITSKSISLQRHNEDVQQALDDFLRRHFR
jgi:pimeloyl-ACP methyl ester carboxylesterase